MEEKQLDFNQPFLSVRRQSSTPAPSEAQGRRRKVVGSLHKLPPLPTYKSQLKSGPVRNPGKVPFVWEKIPGKPKEEKQLQNGTAPECPPAAPKLPPGRSKNFEVKHQDSGKDSTVVTDIDSQRIIDTHPITQEVAKPAPTRDISEEEIRDKGSSSSEGGDEAFLDARDTFSRSDSFFLNCSVISGLSGLDGPDFRSAGKFNTDPMARDFMMGRFLPAAKAMASEAPHHTVRKPLPLAQEIPRPKKVSHNGANVPLRNVLNGSEGESDDDDFDDYDNSAAKVCGLLPRFCILNPVPGIKSMQPPRPHSTRRVQGKSSCKGSAAENRTKRTPREKDGKRLEGSDLYKRLQGNGQILKPKEVSLRAAFEAEGPVGTAYEKLNNSSVDVGTDPPGKRCTNFRELLASEGSEWESSSTGPVAERTLYVDSVRFVKSQNSSTCSSDSKVLSNHDDLEVKGAALSKSSCRETKQSDLPNGKLIDLEAEEIKKQVSFSPMLSDKPDCVAQVDTLTSSTDELELTVEAKEKNGGEAYSGGKIDTESPSATNSVGREVSLLSNLGFHLPPPLLKSPSDSWLSRTLLVTSSKSSSSHQPPSGTDAVLSRRATVSKSPPIETKWETIVRTSNVHHGHLRFSKELLPPVPDA